MISRRALLLPAAPRAAGTLAIHPRVDWAAQQCDPAGPLRKEEAPQFVLFHHSEIRAPRRPDEVVRQLRSFFRYHTTTKGWSDLAYNFLIDPFGGVWEGRSGSLAGPVRGDATGGSQGHAELCCFMGSFTTKPPTDKAVNAAAQLLAWLAERDGIDLHAGRTISFTSRGSNRWPKGATVTTWPVAGHREMSQTSCPGDALYPLLRRRILPAAQQVLDQSASPSRSASLHPTVTPSAPATTLTAPAPGAPPSGTGWQLPAAIGVPAVGVIAAGAWYVQRRRTTGGQPPRRAETP